MCGCSQGINFVSHAVGVCGFEVMTLWVCASLPPPPPSRCRHMCTKAFVVLYFILFYVCMVTETSSFLEESEVTEKESKPYLSMRVCSSG